MKYVFLGSTASINGVKLARYGSIFDMDQEKAEKAARENNSPIIPLDLYCGPSVDELKQRPTTAHHGTFNHRDQEWQNVAPPEFLAKRDAAWKAMHEWRESLKAPKEPIPEAPETPQEAV